jgi:hypothetical protein
MLKRTERNIVIVFALVLFFGIGYFLYKGYLSVSPLNPPGNKFVRNLSFYFTPHRQDSPVNSSISIDWFTKMKKESVNNQKNYKIEQVKLVDNKWETIENGRKIKINFVQYVYAPYVDTEEKRKKAKPEERDRKVTQIFLEIAPPAERNDFIRVRVKNVEDGTGSKLEGEEYAVVQVTDFNKLIQR